MGRPIFIGLAAEGPTDLRFLASIVFRTFQDIAYKECDYDLELQLFLIDIPKIGLDFPEFTKQASLKGVSELGISILAIHTDADRDSYEERKQHKFVPAQSLLDSAEEDCCKILVPIIPVRMIEAWMLADTALLKEEMGTNKNDHDLGIDRFPESIADPKNVIQEAIRLATADKPKRRQRLSIGELYSIIGDKIELSKLDRLDSYTKFREEVREAYRKLNCIH